MTKCRVCGNEHSGGCAQFFASDSRVTPKKRSESAAPKQVRIKPAQRAKAGAPNVPNKAAARRTAAWREENAERHREYMRGLMARRRAARREKDAAP